MTPSTLHKVLLGIKWLSILSGLMLMLVGILRYFMFVTMLSEPWTLFLPAYLIIFGALIAAVELDIEKVFAVLPSMRSFLSRGIFDIFVATICSSFVGSSGLNAFATAVSIILFIVGVACLIMRCLGHEALGANSLSTEKSSATATSTTTTTSTNSNDVSVTIQKPLQESYDSKA